MERKKVLVGYETIKGVIFSKYEKQILEDDGSITSEGIERLTITSEAYDALKKAKFVDQVLLNNTTEVHQVTVELLNTKDSLIKESSEKMIALTRLEAHKEELKHASEVCDTQADELIKLKIINDEIYKENQSLKADKEKLIKDLVIMAERVINPGKSEVFVKEVIKEVVNDANEKHLASEVERLSNKIVDQDQSVLKFDTENKAFRFENETLKKEISSLQILATDRGKEVGELKEQLKAKK